MPTDKFDLSQLFASLADRRFASYSAFDHAVEELFATHRAAFPVAYDYRKAIRWAREHGMLVVEGHELRVKTTN